MFDNIYHVAVYNWIYSYSREKGLGNFFVHSKKKAFHIGVPNRV